MNEVLVYSTPNCVHCNHLKEFLVEHNVVFTVIDVAANPEARQEMIELSGQMGVPVMRAGNDVLIGYSEEKVREILNIK